MALRVPNFQCSAFVFKTIFFIFLWVGQAAFVYGYDYNTRSKKARYCCQS